MIYAILLAVAMLISIPLGIYFLNFLAKLMPLPQSIRDHQAALEHEKWLAERDRKHLEQYPEDSDNW